MGFMVAPTADQDNHRKNWGSATPARTAIIAPELTKKALLDAIRRRHVYATEDPNLRVIIKVNGHLCGDVLPVLPARSRLDITYEIADDDEPGADCMIRVFGDRVGGTRPRSSARSRRSRDASGQVRGRIEDVVFSGVPQYLFFKVTQFDEDGGEDDAWTAPIWFRNDDVWTSPVWFRNDPGTLVATSNENVGLVTPGRRNRAPIDADRAVASKSSNSFHLSIGVPRRPGASSRITSSAARRPARVVTCTRGARRRPVLDDARVALTGPLLA